MTYFLGAVAGLVWGALAVFINLIITKGALKKGTTAAISLMSLERTMVDVTALATIFLLRNMLPFSPVVALVATAIAISVGTLVCSFLLIRKK